MIGTLEGIKYDVVSSRHALEENRFLKILINSKDIYAVIKLLKKYKEHNYFYVSCDNNFIRIDLIISYLNEESKRNRKYYDILSELIKVYTYAEFACGCYS